VEQQGGGPFPLNNGVLTYELLCPLWIFENWWWRGGFFWRWLSNDMPTSL